VETVQSAGAVPVGNGRQLPIEPWSSLEPVPGATVPASPEARIWPTLVNLAWAGDIRLQADEKRYLGDLKYSTPRALIVIARYDDIAAARARADQLRSQIPGVTTVKSGGAIPGTAKPHRAAVCRGGSRGQPTAQPVQYRCLADACASHGAQVMPGCAAA
jgi:hypothetical protein